MRVLDRPERAAAMLLGGIAVLNAFMDVATGRPQRVSGAAPMARVLPVAGSTARKTMDWCLENVTMIHDVYWASACATEAKEQRAPGGEPPDDSPDCTLPEGRARVLNAARAEAEQQCVDEALPR
jgi:hypothetical protein